MPWPIQQNWPADSWRGLTIGVKPQYLEAALERCKELGLDPRVCGYQGPNDVGVLFAVIVPCSVCRNPQPDFLAPYMGPFHGALVHGVKTSLVCPVEEEPQHSSNDPRWR